MDRKTVVDYLLSRTEKVQTLTNEEQVTKRVIGEKDKMDIQKEYIRQIEEKLCMTNFGEPLKTYMKQNLELGKKSRQ